MASIINYWSLYFGPLIGNYGQLASINGSLLLGNLKHQRPRGGRLFELLVELVMGLFWTTTGNYGREAAAFFYWATCVNKWLTIIGHLEKLQPRRGSLFELAGLNKLLTFLQLDNVTTSFRSKNLLNFNSLCTISQNQPILHKITTVVKRSPLA